MTTPSSAIYSVKHTEERDRIDRKISELEATLLALKRQRNLLAPISTLPHELSLFIFEMLKPTKAPGNGRHSIHDLIAASQVCTSWRNLAISTPSLWKHILIFDSNATQEIMCRSGSSHPLSVTIRMDQITRYRTEKIYALAATFLQLLETKCSRIEYLELHPVASEDYASDRDIDWTWGEHFDSFIKSLSTHTFEKLHTLILGCKFDPYNSYIHDSGGCDVELPADAFVRLPSLQVLELYHCVAFQPLPPPGSLVTLTTLRIIDPLDRMSSLKAIVILQDIPNLTTLEMVRFLLPVELRRDIFPFSLPRLRQLTIRDTTPNFVDFLDAFNPSPHLRVSFYLDDFEVSHTMLLTPFLREMWTGRILSIRLLSSPAWGCHLCLDSRPAVTPDTDVDCMVSFDMGSGRHLENYAGYTNIIESCRAVTQQLNTSYVESFSTNIPINAFNWYFIARDLPSLTTVTMSYDNDQALGLTFALVGVPKAILPQVGILVIDMGPDALSSDSQEELVGYACRRVEAGCRCKKIEFRTTPLSTGFIERLREYVDDVDGIVDDDMYAGMS